MDRARNAALRFLSVPAERLAEIREIVRSARAGLAERPGLPARAHLDRDGLVRRAMEEIARLLDLPPIPIATEAGARGGRAFEVVTPRRMASVVVIHPDVIDGVEDPAKRAELLAQLVFEVPLAHLAAHQAGRLNLRQAEEFFAWAAERAGL